MHAKIKLTLLAIVVAVFGFATPVLAVDDMTTTDTQTTTEVEATTEIETKAETVQTTAEEKKKTMEERLKAYKEKQQQQLAEAQSKRIAARCQSAQVKITSLRSRITTVVDNRKAVYENIDNKLTELLAKLQKAGIDTTTYETAQEDLKVDLASLNESMEAYGLVLDDLAAMDCAADPEAFKAALESARATQKDLREKSQAFRSFATTQLKTIMQEVRAQLETLKAESSTDTTGEEQQ